MLQKIIVFVIVGCAVLFLARKLYLFFRGKAGPCAGCTRQCPMNTDCPSFKGSASDEKKP